MSTDDTPARPARLEVDGYRIGPGMRLDLSTVDPQANGGLTKKQGVRLLDDLRRKVAELQFKLYADDRHRLLIVLQAMDAGGKDGAIRKVFAGVNPQGVKVTSFKAPTPEELSHDFLWRIHDHAPADGNIAVFNRSHYEDVLVVRVLDLVPESRWRPRYGHIRSFEQMLVDEGTTILKFYLHISPEEQAERLQERLDDPTRNWKFNAADLEHRALWSRYMEAFEDAISETSTRDAPWIVVPANRKWFRNIVIAQTIVDTLEAMDLRFPPAEDGLETITIPPVDNPG